MFAAARMLTKNVFPPHRALVVARVTKVQVEGNLFFKHQREIKLEDDPFNLDDF